MVDTQKMRVRDDVCGMFVRALESPVASSASGQIPMPLSLWMRKRMCACQDLRIGGHYFSKTCTRRVDLNGPISNF